MKKIANIISIIFVVLLFYLTKNKDILPLTISFSLYILFNSLFSTTQIKNKNYKVFKMSLISIIVTGLFLIIISYLIGDILKIDKLNIINVLMSISLISNVILKLINEYLEIIGYKKLTNRLPNIYKITTIIIKIIITILLFGVFKTNSNINIMLLYMVDVIVVIIIIIILYIFIFKKIDKKEKCKNKIEEIKKVLVNDKIKTILNIINSSYIYISIIVLYYTLINKYNHNYDNVSIYINNTYFYALIAAYYIYKLIKNNIHIDIKNDFNDNLNKVIKISLTSIILLTVISMPLSNIIFNTEVNILANIIPLLSIYILYDFIINMNINHNKHKNIVITLVAGLIISMIFEIPLINAVYRMGYTLTFGSILSIVLGLITSIIIGIILLKKKLKLNFLNNFNNLLNIIYENIIYTLILVLFTFIIKINTTSIISSVLVVLFYIFITVTFIYIKNKLDKDKFK